RHVVEKHFSWRKNSKPTVAENAYVEFATIDVLLDQRITIEFLVDELCTLNGFALVARKRCFADAIRRLLGSRFHERRKLKALKPAKRRRTVRDHEAWYAHVVVCEYLLGDRFVFT